MEDAPGIMNILLSAIQMEIDGREFYLKAGEKSNNELARSLFKTLADEENLHQEKAREIYNTVKAGGDWPDQDMSFEQEKQKVDTIFSVALKNAEHAAIESPSDLEAVRIALDMENKSFEFYKKQGGEATHPAEMKFYQALASQEKWHYMTLLDTEEYLSDTEGWIMAKQHITLDGA